MMKKLLTIKTDKECYENLMGTLYDVVIIRGIPGSGKSTLARKLVNSSCGMWDYQHLETDNYWLRPDGYYDFNFNRLSEAHEWNLNEFKRAIRDKDPTIVSNTFVKLSTIVPYVKVAIEEFLKFDHNPSILVVDCTGDYGSVHNVPQVTVDKMRKNFEDSAGLEKLIANL
jgi:hypothetical protein